MAELENSCGADEIHWLCTYLLGEKGGLLIRDLSSASHSDLLEAYRTCHKELEKHSLSEALNIVIDAIVDEIVSRPATNSLLDVDEIDLYGVFDQRSIRLLRHGLKSPSISIAEMEKCLLAMDEYDDVKEINLGDQHWEKMGLFDLMREMAEHPQASGKLLLELLGYWGVIEAGERLLADLPNLVGKDPSCLGRITIGSDDQRHPLGAWSWLDVPEREMPTRVLEGVLQLNEVVNERTLWFDVARNFQGDGRLLLSDVASRTHFALSKYFERDDKVWRWLDVADIDLASMRSGLRPVNIEAVSFPVFELPLWDEKESEEHQVLVAGTRAG